MRLDALQTMLEREPTDAFLLFAIAKEYEKKYDDATAQTYYERCHTYNPTYVGLYYHLGKLHERAQNLDAAIHIYKEGMQVAQAAGDRHALSELAMAKLELVDEED